MKKKHGQGDRCHRKIEGQRTRDGRDYMIDNDKVKKRNTFVGRSTDRWIGSNTLYHVVSMFLLFQSPQGHQSGNSHQFYFRTGPQPAVSPGQQETKGIIKVTKQSKQQIIKTVKRDKKSNERNRSPCTKARAWLESRAITKRNAKKAEVQIKRQRNTQRTKGWHQTQRRGKAWPIQNATSAYGFLWCAFGLYWNVLKKE